MQSYSESFLSAWVKAMCHQLGEALTLLQQEQYCGRLPVLDGASTGMHFRHIIEFFECLQQGYESGAVNYSARNRSLLLETDHAFACGCIQTLAAAALLPDKPMDVLHNQEALPPFRAASTYYRELWYVLEHAVHHMALLKIGYRALGIQLAEDFGVAPSTLQYRKVCAS